MNNYNYNYNNSGQPQLYPNQYYNPQGQPYPGTYSYNQQQQQQQQQYRQSSGYQQQPGLYQQQYNQNQQQNYNQPTVIPMQLNLSAKQQQNQAQHNVKAPVQNQPQYQPADLFQDLQNNNFKFRREKSTSSTMMIETAFVELPAIPNIQDLEIKIDIIQNQFPHSPPSLSTTKPMVHQLINAGTNELRYQEIYRWEPGKSSLSELMKALVAHFQIQPPMEDPMVRELQEVMKYNEDQVLGSIKTLSLGQILPAVNSNEYSSLSDQRVIEEVIKCSTYQDLIQLLLNLSQQNEILYDNTFLQGRIMENDKELRSKASSLQNLDRDFQITKDSLIMHFTQANAFKERFDMTKILNVLDKIKEKLDDQTQDILAGESTLDVMNYFELRKKYHKYSIKIEKFQQIM